MTAPFVRNNEDKSRFEIEVEGEVAFAEYHLVDDHIVFPHTVVPKALEGRGLGAKLVEAGLEYAREEGLSVVPRCSFFARYFERHPEHRELLHHDWR